MSPTGFRALHLERDRAESFGSVAEQYERYRPAFPEDLFDDLAAMAGSTPVLDVGSGTGKVARGLAQRGLAVLGIELDPRMADVARERGVRVEVARFEDWDDAGRRFDLLTCGDAWHWIDPKRGAEMVAKVLRPGGAFARFWNIQLGRGVGGLRRDDQRSPAPAARAPGGLARDPRGHRALRRDDPRAHRHEHRVRAPWLRASVPEPLPI